MGTKWALSLAAVAFIVSLCADAALCAPRHAWSLIQSAAGPAARWRRIRSISYRYLVHHYSPRGRIKARRVERHTLKRIQGRLHLHIDYGARDGHWELMTGPCGSIAKRSEQIFSWPHLPAQRKIRAGLNLQILNHPFLLGRMGTTTRYLGTSTVRGIQCFAYGVEYRPEDRSPMRRSRLDFDTRSGLLKRLVFNPVDAPGQRWEVYLDHHLPTKRFSPPRSREILVDGVLRWKGTMTELRFNPKVQAKLFTLPPLKAKRAPIHFPRRRRWDNYPRGRSLSTKLDALRKKREANALKRDFRDMAY